MPNRGQWLVVVACEVLANVGFREFFVASRGSNFFLLFDVFILLDARGSCARCDCGVHCMFLCHRKGLKAFGGAFAT
jgi:hypothetical protein